MIVAAEAKELTAIEALKINQRDNSVDIHRDLLAATLGERNGDDIGAVAAVTDDVEGPVEGSYTQIQKFIDRHVEHTSDTDEEQELIHPVSALQLIALSAAEQGVIVRAAVEIVSLL